LLLTELAPIREASPSDGIGDIAMILARLNFIATTGLFVVVMLAQAAAEPCRMWDVTGGWHSIQGNYFGVRIGINPHSPDDALSCAVRTPIQI
jgi:hypothetical protein